MDGRKKKKITIIGMALVLVVVAIVGTVVGVRKHNRVRIDSAKAGEMKLLVGSTAMIILCQHTDYKKVCEDNLLGSPNRDPKELVKVTFNSAVEHVQEAIEKSYPLKEATQDPRASKALDTCKELLDTSIDDLKRAFNKLDVFDLSRMDEYASDLRVWLSGAVTYQETCLDAFENTTGDSGRNMRFLLTIGRELTRNSLAMLDGIADLFGGLKVNRIGDGHLGLASNNGFLPNVMDLKPMERNRRMLDDTSDDDHMHVPYSKPRMLGQPSNIDHLDLKNLKPYFGKRKIRADMVNEKHSTSSDSKPMTSHDDHVQYPSWADAARRSLINVDPKTIKPNAIVAQDGSETFKTIMEAVNTVPKKGTEPFIILIKAGIFNEYVTIPRHVNNIVFLGEGPTKTKITGNKNYIDGVGTYQTATVAVNGDGFMAKDIWFENSAGPQKHQAVALRVSADMTIFHNCAMDGYQDTLYAHSYRQFFRQCTITGTIDFLFGDAAAVFQDCKMIVRKPLENQACMVTAQGRKDHHSVGGLVLQGCTITAEPDFMNTIPMPKSYLGRPWKEFSRTIIMQSFIDTNIVPEGWSPWTGTFALDTCYYAEFNNRGPGSNKAQRVTWKGIKNISPREAQTFTPGRYIQGDAWITAAGVPYDSGMMNI